MAKSLFTKEGREEEVRKMIERGLRQREIAERLGVSLKTVSNDAKSIRKARQMAERKKVYAEDVQVIKDLPFVKFSETSREEVRNAIMDTMQSIYLELKRRLPIMSNEEVNNMAMSLLRRDDD